MFKNDDKQTRKADLTRQKLFKIAMDLISQDGFEGTTMRAIAGRAGVAPGAIYYHFESKESLIQEYYSLSHEEHVKALEGFFEKEFQFSRRLQKVVKSKIEGALPYKDMARALFRVAANPESPLSPFSEQSRALRLESLKIFDEVVEGSTDKFIPEIKKILPKYLWLYQMGIILFWIYDKSEGSNATFQLIDKTVPLIASTNQMLLSPLAVPFRKKIISILKSFVPDLGEEVISTN